jgi:hypothetical protein
VARRNIPPAHWGYLVSGVDHEIGETLKPPAALPSQ